MFSKFKFTSVSSAFTTRLLLIKVYEAESGDWEAKISFLKHQNNSLVVQLNDAHSQVRTKASFNASQKRFFELTKAARNNKKRRIKNLVVQLLKGLHEFVPIELCSFLPYFIFFVATPFELPIDFISIINTVTPANNYQATVSSHLHSPRWRSATLQKLVFAWIYIFRRILDLHSYQNYRKRLE